MKHYLISPKLFSYNHQHGSTGTEVPFTSYLRSVDLEDSVWFVCVDVLDYFVAAVCASCYFCSRASFLFKLKNKITTKALIFL